MQHVTVHAALHGASGAAWTHNRLPLPAAPSTPGGHAAIRCIALHPAERWNMLHVCMRGSVVGKMGHVRHACTPAPCAAFGSRSPSSPARPSRGSGMAAGHAFSRRSDTAPTIPGKLGAAHAVVYIHACTPVKHCGPPQVKGSQEEQPASILPGAAAGSHLSVWHSGAAAATPTRPSGAPCRTCVGNGGNTSNRRSLQCNHRATAVLDLAVLLHPPCTESTCCACTSSSPMGIGKPCSSRATPRRQGRHYAAPADLTPTQRDGASPCSASGRLTTAFPMCGFPLPTVVLCVAVRTVRVVVRQSRARKLQI